MKKKIAITAAIVIVLLLVLGSAGVLFFVRSLGPSDAAKLVPQQTVLLIDLPDLPRTAMRWPATALAKIGAEPEMKAFLEKPFARLGKEAGPGEAGNLLAGLKPIHLFLALTNVSPAKTEVLVGFQFWGNQADFDRAVARLRAQLGTPSQPSEEVYNGSTIVGAQQNTTAVYSATQGRWGFVSTDLDVIKAALDRASGKNHDTALAENPAYKKVASQLLSQPDFTFFIQPQAILNTLLEVGQSTGAQQVVSQIESLRNVEAIGGTLKLDGLLQRDAIFVLKGTTNPSPVLANRAASLTSPETTLYWNLLTDFAIVEKILASIGNADAATFQPLALLAAEAYGPEGALIANWPTAQMAPSAFFALEVKDPVKAATCLSQFLTMFPATTITEQDGVKLYAPQNLQNPLASPILAQTDSFLFIGMDAATITAAATTPSTKTLTDAPAFEAARQSFGAANQMFAFVDTQAFFDRAYNGLRPVIIFSSALMPTTAEWIDSSKLPQTATISQHLPPILYSQRASADGTLIESSGPITMNQAMVIGLMGAVSASPSLIGR